MRRDWWRFWAAVREAPGYTRGAVSVTLTARGKERCLGVRTPSRWVEDHAPTPVRPVRDAGDG